MKEKDLTVEGELQKHVDYIFMKNMFLPIRNQLKEMHLVEEAGAEEDKLQ